MNISLRINDETAKRLDKVAKDLDRSRSWVVMEAVERYIAHHDWFTTSVEKAIEAAEAGGPFVSHDDVVAKVANRKKAAVQ